MAAGTLPKPGTAHGPCNHGGDRCGHKDCAATRHMAKAPCIHCSKPIGYETPFYSINDSARIPDGHPTIESDYGVKYALAHALCHEQWAEALRDR